MPKTVFFSLDLRESQPGPQKHGLRLYNSDRAFLFLKRGLQRQVDVDNNSTIDQGSYLCSYVMVTQANPCAISGA
jgi:hypothetical protein